MTFPEELVSTKHTRLLATLGSYALRPSWQVSALAADPDGQSFWALCGQHRLRWSVVTGEELPDPKNTAPSITLQAQQSWTKKWPFPNEEGVLTAEEKTLSAFRIQAAKKPENAKQKSKTTTNKTPKASKPPVTQQDLLWSRTFEGNLEGCAFLTSSARVVVSYQGFKELESKGKYSFLCRLDCLALSTGEEQWSVSMYDHGLDPPIIDAEGRTSASGSLGSPITSADGNTIAVLLLLWKGDERQIRALVFRASGEKVCEIEVESYGDNSLLLAPDGSWLVCCEHQNTSFRIFDLPSGKDRMLGAGHNSRVIGLGWLGDSRRLLSAAMHDPQVRLWDVERQETDALLEPREKPPQALRVLPNGFVAAFYQGGVEAFDFSGSCLASIQSRDLGSNKSIEASKDGEWVYWDGATASGESFVFAWNVSEREPRWRFKIPQYKSVTLSASTDGESLWVFEDTTAVQLDAKTGKALSRCELPYQHTYKDATLLQDGETAVGFISWYDRSMYEGKEYLRKWNCFTGDIEWSREQSALTISKLLVSRSERWGVRANYNKVVFYDLSNGERLDELVLDGVNDTTWSIALSPDETRLAIGTDRGMVLVFALEGLAQLRVEQ